MNKLFKINNYELLSRKVYHILKKRIIEEDLKPGEKILEVNIAEQLGVSRTPIREALRELAAEGFVKMIPNQRMVVSNVSIEDIKEVLQVRILLEGFAAPIAAKKINKGEIKKLEKIIEKMNISVSKDDAVAYSNLNGEFHNLILKVCGNKRFIKICANLSGSDYRFRIRALRDNSERLKYSLKEHQEIVDALKKKDSEQAGSRSKKHIENVLKNILAYKSKEEEIENNASN